MVIWLKDDVKIIDQIKLIAQFMAVSEFESET